MELFNNLKKIVLVVEYNGECYHGFQWQPGIPTIQDELEKAIQKLTGEQRRVLAACRTDAGVHAEGQVVSFRMQSILPLERYISGLNHYLPEDISVKMAGVVSEAFNVMKDAVKREYKYLILNRRIRSPLTMGYYYIVGKELDTDLMDQATKKLVGEHDFASFVTCWDREESTVRNIYEADIKRDGEKVTFQVSANAFIMHQVRNIVGTLIQVGTKKIGLEEFKNILELKQLSLAGPTAPAHGLCLMKVSYASNSEFKYENLCA